MDTLRSSINPVCALSSRVVYPADKFYSLAERDDIRTVPHKTFEIFNLRRAITKELLFPEFVSLLSSLLLIKYSHFQFPRL